jgi:hypothetical protein
MKSKAPLVMMEQIIMVLVFSLAAALCLQTFVLSGKISKRTETKNRAAVEAQNVAELMKADGVKRFSEHYKPEKSEEGYKTLFTEDWQITKEDNSSEYTMTVSYENVPELSLWKAEIILVTADGEELVRIPVAGQTEVAGNE